MNTPQAAFTCGMPQVKNWQKLFGQKVFVFERHRSHERSRDLASLISRWLQRQGIPRGSGYIHLVQFPEQESMEMMAWTAYRAFHLQNPNNQSDGPRGIVLFTSSAELLKWKREQIISENRSREIAVFTPFRPTAYGEETIQSKETLTQRGYHVMTPYHPDGKRLTRSRLLIF